MNNMLKGILSIAGQGGLFKLISQGNNSIIVESLVDGKRMPAHGTSRVSALEDISMYTEDGDVKLSYVFACIYEFAKGEKCIDVKKASAADIKEYMGNVLPNWDKEHIYMSDLKRLFTWYNLLLEKGVITAENAQKAKEESTEE